MAIGDRVASLSAFGKENVVVKKNVGNNHNDLLTVDSRPLTATPIGEKNVHRT